MTEKPDGPIDAARREQTEHETRDLQHLYAKALYEHGNPGRQWEDAHPDDLLLFTADANAVLRVRDDEMRRLRTQLAVAAAHEDWASSSVREAERRAGRAEAAIERIASPAAIRAAALAMSDEALTRLGRDLGTIHIEAIAEAAIRAALAEPGEPTP